MFQPPKGMRDLPPEEAARYQYVIDILRNVFEKYGFLPLDTPALEPFELFAAKGGVGENVRDEIYCFKDKSGRELALRFEFTASLARFVLNNPNIPKPFKRWQIGKVWRYDNPQALRYREFWQADVDIVGVSSPLADAECLAAFCECLRMLGFKKFFIRVNDRKLLERIFGNVVPKEKIFDVFRIIDKLDKIGEEGVKKQLKEKGFDTEKILRAINVHGSNKQILEKIKEKGGDTSEFEQFLKFAKQLGIGKYLKIDLSLVRGLEYYTSLVFEVMCGANVSCGGGGRFDNLIKSFGGPDLPATGISFGLSRLIAIMEEQKLFKKINQKKIFIAPVNAEMQTEAIKILNKLRASGIFCETDLLGRKLSKQLEYASALTIPYVAIVGPAELKKKAIRLHDMKSGKEQIVAIGKIKSLVG